MRASFEVRPRAWEVLLACWCLIGVAHVGRSLIHRAYRPGYWLPEDASVLDAVIDGVYDAGLWFATSLGAYGVAWWLEFDARRWGRSAVLFAAAALGLVAARFAVVELVSAVTPLPGMGSAAEYLPHLPGQLIYTVTGIGAGYSVRYFVHLSEQEPAAARLQAELAEARLRALGAQLHPHFLFNALNSVSALLHLDASAAGRLVRRLRRLLRMVLETGSAELVPLEHEVALARTYLELEQVRFGERLAVSIRVDSRAEALLVPALVLQPCVENAVRHGAAPAGRRVGVSVTAHVEPGGRVLRLEVEDDGVGLPAGGAAAAGGIGLRNTRERLRHLYGTAQSVEVAPRPGGGTRVRIELPATRAPARGLAR